MGRRELRAADQQTLASVQLSWTTKSVSIGGRSFKADAGPSWSSGIAEIADRSQRDKIGHFAETSTSQRRQVEASGQKLSRGQRWRNQTVQGNLSMRRERLSCTPAGIISTSGLALAYRLRISDGSDS